MRQFDALPLRNRTEQVFVALVALSLLSMPVSYKGGARESHPHVFVQLWIDAAENSFNHHHRPGDDGQPKPVDPASHPHSESTQPNLALDRVASDGPRLTAMTSPAVETLALIAGFWLVVMLAGNGGQSFAERPIPFGRLPRPEPPPPKLILVPS